MSADYINGLKAADKLHLAYLELLKGENSNSARIERSLIRSIRRDIARLIAEAKELAA